MILDNKKCPFKVGDYVIYVPSPRNKTQDVMASISEQLTPGKEYTVAKIQNGEYVLVKEYSHLGGGIYWTEFDEVRRNKIG